MDYFASKGFEVTSGSEIGSAEGTLDSMRIGNDGVMDVSRKAWEEAVCKAGE